MNGTTVGDHVVHFVVEVPTALTAKQRHAVELFAEDEVRDPPTRDTLHRLKDTWRALFSM